MPSFLLHDAASLKLGVLRIWFQMIVTMQPCIEIVMTLKKNQYKMVIMNYRNLFRIDYKKISFVIKNMFDTH